MLYDRATESVWYPGEGPTLDAVAGPRQGTAIDFLAEPEPQSLSSWLRTHPDSQVLLPSDEDARAIRRPRTGLRFTDRDDAAEVRRVVEGSAAEVAGIEPGDLVLRLADRPVSSPSDLLTVLDELVPGDEVEIVLDRGGETLRVVVTLAAPEG